MKLNTQLSEEIYHLALEHAGLENMQRSAERNLEVILGRKFEVYSRLETLRGIELTIELMRPHPDIPYTGEN
jgi:hypothetical protein